MEPCRVPRSVFPYALTARLLPGAQITGRVRRADPDETVLGEARHLELLNKLGELLELSPDLAIMLRGNKRTVEVIEDARFSPAIQEVSKRLLVRPGGMDSIPRDV